MVKTIKMISTELLSEENSLKVFIITKKYLAKI